MLATMARPPWRRASASLRGHYRRFETRDLCDPSQEALDALVDYVDLTKSQTTNAVIRLALEEFPQRNGF
jgi:hypothetical protein